MTYIRSTAREPSDQERIRVLHVDDHAELLDLSTDLLERECDRIEVLTEQSAEAGLDRLETDDIDCIVSDYDMPRSNGLEFLEQVRDQYPELPFILFTGKGSEEIASEAISAGVTDYLQKAGPDQYTVLAHRLENAVGQYRSRRAVEATERTFMQLAQQTDDLLFMFEGDWSDLIFVNSAYEDMFGGSIEDLRDDPHDYVNHIHPEDRDLASDAVERLQLGEAIDIEYRIVPEPDTIRWVSSLAKPIFDEDGEVERIAGFVRDVTEHKRRESELAAQVTAMEEATDGIAILDEDRSFVYVNEKYAEMYGFEDPENLLGRSWRACYAEPDQARFESDILPELPASGSWQGELTVTAADGRELHHELTMSQVEDDRVVCVVEDVTERWRRERELERYELITKHVSDSIGIVDEEGTIRYENSAIERILGYEPAELEGTNAFEYMHPEDRDEVLEQFLGLVDGDEDIVERVRYRMRHADGSWRWLESEATGRTTGALDGYVITSRDVTERKRREAELEQYAALVNNMADTACVIDDEWRIEFANEASLEYAQENLSSLQGRQVTELTNEFAADPEDVERFEAALQRSFEEGTAQSVEIDLDLPTGSATVDFQISTVTIDGDAKAMVTGRNVTERNRREEALKALQEVTQPLMDQADREAVALEAVEATPAVLDHPVSGVWLFDDQRDALEPVAVTEAGRDIIEDVPHFDRGEGLAWQVYQREELEVYDDLHDEPDRLNPDTPIRSEILLPLGEYGIMAIGHTEPNSFDDVDVALAQMFSNTVRSALDRADREARLRNQHRKLERQNERLDQFASIVSHDLRNPLNVAQGHLDLLEEECDSERIDAMRSAHDRMGALIEDILTLAREGSIVDEPTENDLRELLESSWANVETGTAKLDVRTDQVVRADEGRLAQLLENLIGNAVEHGGSDVTIIVGELPDGFYVADDGVGIEEDRRDRVLEAGYSTTGDGTGFGLNIVERIADAHGWTISITESNSGGARFEIRDVDCTTSER